MTILDNIKISKGWPVRRSAKAGAKSTACRIKKDFPYVETIHDALSPVEITVKNTDCKKAVPHDHRQCAFAKAACRAADVDGAYIGIKTSYLICGDKAVKFSTPNLVTREIVSFDRNSDFKPGNYYLSSVCPSQRTGVKKPNKNPRRESTGKTKPGHRLLKKRGRTLGVRARM